MKKELKHIDLSSIKDPSFLKDLSYKELDLLCDDIREYLIDITSKNGGHLSSNLGVVESTVALCRTFDFKKDKIIFDVGHQSYTYKLLTGRDLSSLRTKDGISGFQKLNESIYDHYEAGHSSTSISAGLGMAIARDLNKENYDVISFIGDSSFVSGLSFEGFNNASYEKHKMIIIINDNDMSISSSVGGMSNVFRKLSTSNFYLKSKKFYKKILLWNKLGRALYSLTYKFKNFIKRLLVKMSIFDMLDYSVIGPVDGHNIKSIEKALSKAKKSDKSVIVLLKTIKGKGFKPAEEDKEGKWHGVSSFDKTNTDTTSSDVSWSKYFADLVLEKLSNDKKAVVITPGTGYGSCLSKVKKEFPDRYFDVGIAEEHALVLASGLSISGYHPIICIYSTFLQRAYDELSHDLARMNLDATILIDRAGLVGNDGETHQGIYDEAFLNSIPNVTISMPSSNEEAKELFNESFMHHGPFAIRFPRENIVSGNENKFNYGDWIKEKEGKEVAIISLGPVIQDLKDKLVKYNVSLYNALYLSPINEKWIKDLLSYKKIIVYDPYGTENGLLSMVEKQLLMNNFKGEVINKTIKNLFVKQASIKEQRDDLSLSIDDVISLLNK